MDKAVLNINPDDLIISVMKNLVSRLPMESYFGSLEMFYGDKHMGKKPLEITKLLIDGLRENNMPEFYRIMNGITKHVSS